MSEFALLDIAALGFFLAVWAGYTLIVDKSRWKSRSITAAMGGYRLRWMQQMVGRDVRIVDSTILGNLANGIGFFASATILVIGGLVAVLGAAEQSIEALSYVPFAVRSPRVVWEAKVVLELVIFVYAFFKFAWSFRLNNYCSILVGAAPPPSSGAAALADHAARAAALSTLVGHHFNRGLRAYFFGLAALGWFVHPLLFLLATVGVVGVVYHREFRSAAIEALRA